LEEFKEYVFEVTMKISLVASPGKEDEELEAALDIFANEADVGVEILKKRLLEVKEYKHWR